MNREIYPGGIYPLTGDVQSKAGQQTVTVIAIQGVPVQQTYLNGGEVLSYNPSTRQWEPRARAAIQVDNVTMSDDYTITVNVPRMVTVNGS